MLAKEIETRYTNMIEELENFNGSIKGSIENLSASLTLIRETLQSLREYLCVNPFSSKEQEIAFFKHTKPRFYSWQIYCIELHHILAAVPIGTDQMIRDYYMNELNILDRFFKLHAFYYQYYLRNENSKDDLYFLRRNRTLFPPGGELLLNDPEFSTELDYLFSTFRAYEKLRNFIIRRIKILHQESDQGLMNEILSNQKRWWSGDKVELVEIAYGIYYSRRMNDGKAEISDIVNWLEESLHIDLSQAYRMFVDIRRRKTVSYTKFLDEMRNEIHTHIEETFKYNPKSRNLKK
ncbi:MAG: RteC domain-containing protein [Sphingobacterium sp.]|jgi:hypothetical protein|nr:RteC domain-containing protein [Sphingobacterium sp.]